jgi:hypothetical protein
VSLRAFHLFFIGVSIILTAYVATWAGGQYRASHDMTYVLASAASIVGGVGLAVYGAAFQRKTRRLS